MVKLGCVNAHSIVEKGALIQDMIVAHNFDVLAVCETWIVNDDPDAVKLDCAPDGYRVLHQPRPAATRRTRGGGLCVIYRDTLTVKCHPLQRSTHYKTFECQLVSLGSRSNDTVAIAVVYRPPSTSLDAFCVELSDLFTRVGDEIDADRFVACGDYNCGGVDPESVRDELATLLDTHGLQQSVPSATRFTPTTCSLLDLIISPSGSSRLQFGSVEPTHGVSDHHIVTWSIATRTRPLRKVVSYSFRNLKKMDLAQFQCDVRTSKLFTDPAETADAFADQLDTVITKLLYKHCRRKKRSKLAPKRQ